MVNKTKDPVCGMNVDANKSQCTTQHQGKQYNFCCEECLTQFKQNPGKYLSKS